MDTCFYYFFDFFGVVLCSGEASYGFFPFELLIIFFFLALLFFLRRSFYFGIEYSNSKHIV